jgi:hypothetical protein
MSSAPVSLYVNLLYMLAVSYESHFVPSILDIPFSFYNRFCGRVCCYLVIFSKVSVKEQSICVKFCFKVEKAVAETHQMLREVTAIPVTYWRN